MLSRLLAYRPPVWLVILVLTALFLLKHTAYAQERSFTVTLQESDWNYLATVVGKQPYENSSKILNSMLNQVQAQVAAQSAEHQAASIALIEKRKKDEDAAKAAEQPKATEPDK